MKLIHSKNKIKKESVRETPPQHTAVRKEDPDMLEVVKRYYDESFRLRRTPSGRA